MSPVRTVVVARTLLVFGLLVYSASGQFVLSFDSSTPIVVNENDRFSVSLKPTGTPIDDVYAVVQIANTAAAGDFFGTSYPVVFYAGVTPSLQTVTFTTVNDDIPEDDETYTISLTVRGTATLVAPTTVNVTILANDDAYGIFSFKSPRQSWVREPATAVPTMVSLEIIRDRGLFNSVQLGFRVDGAANPDATPGLDVGPAEGQLLFTAGVFSLMLQLQVLPDVTPENNETFTVTLSILGSRGKLLPEASSYSVTVLANDAPVRFEFAQYSVNETDRDTNYRIAVLRGYSTSGSSIGPVDSSASVAVRVGSDGQAGLFSDYRAINQTLEFAAGETRKDISVTVLADEIPEPVEDFSLTLVDPSGDVVVQEPQTTKILINANDDPNGVLELFTNVPGRPGYYTIDEDSASTFTDFKVVRSGGIYGTVSVSWLLQRVNNSDSISSDIGPSEGTVTLDDRVREARITLQIVQDNVPEPAEAFRISLLATRLAGGAKLGGITTGVLVVQDSDMAYGLVSFSTPDQQVLKSKETPRKLEFRLIRTGGTLGAIQILMDVTYSGSSSPNASTVVAASLPIVVPMGIGEATALVQIPLTERAFLHVGETFNARLLNTSYIQPVGSLPAYNSPRLGARLETSVLVAPGDADGEVGFASIGVILANEPGDGAASSFVPIRLIREGMSGAAVIYWNVTSVGPGVTDSDTGPRSGQINLAAGQTSADLVFEIKPDDVPEVDEDLTIQLTDVAPAGTQRLKVNYSSIVLRIRANDNPGGIFSFASFMSDHYVMREEGSPINVTVVRTGGALMTVLVDYSVQPGGDAQFYGGNNVLQFLPGVHSLSGTLMARGDNIPELETNYILSLSGHNGESISIGSKSRINITVPANDDPYGVVEFHASSLLANIKESKGSDIQIARLVVARNRGAFGEVTVQFRVSPDNTSDLSPVSGTIVFENGQAQAILPIQSLPDDLPEDQEQFSVTLFNVTGGASLGSRAQAFVYIDQNDSPVYFSAPSTLRVNEGQSASFTVVRDGSLLESVSISYRTVDITAYSGLNDYISASGVLVFNSGQRQQRLSVQTLDDRAPEGDETFRIELYNPVGDIVPYNQKTATVVIAANDGASGSISFSSPVIKTVNEGSSVSFEVIREGGIFGNVSIHWMIALNGTEESVTDGTEFEFGSGVLTMPDGVAKVPLIIIPRSDNVPEFEEEFSVTIYNLSGGASPEEKPVFGSGPTQAYIIVPQNDDPYGVMSFDQATYSVPEDAYPGHAATTQLTVMVNRLQGRYSDADVSWTILSQSASSLPAVLDLLFLGLRHASVMLADEAKRIPGTGTHVLEFFNVPGSLVTVPEIYQPNTTTTMNSANGFAFSTALQLKQSIGTSCLLSKFFRSNGTDLYGFYISANATSFSVTFRYWSLFRRAVQLTGWTSSTILDARWHYLVVNVFGGQASFFLDGTRFYQGALESATIMDDEGEMYVGAAAGQMHRYIGYLQDVRLYSRKLENNEIAEVSSYPASADVTPISGYLSFPTDLWNSSITLAAVQDAIAEPDEYFTLRLLSAKGGARLSPAGQSSDLVVLKSDAANGIFGFVGSCVPPVSFNESTTFSCSVQRLGGSFDLVNLFWEARLPNPNGTGWWSDAGLQFVNSSGFISFGQGERLKSLTATLIDDQVPELAAQAIFVLTEAVSGDGQPGSTNVSGASIDPNKSWTNVTISESDYPYGYLQFMTALPDPLPSIIPAEFVQPHVSVREEVGFVSLLIARAQGMIGTISCEWRTRDGTATSSGDRPDYRADGNRVQFTPGSQFVRFNVTIFDNAEPEDTRVFYVELLNPIGGAGLGPASTIAVSIENSDSAFGVFGFAPMSMVIYTDEVSNGTALFTVTRAGGTLRSVTVYWQFSSDPGNDLMMLSGSVHFAAGQTVGYFTVGIVDDALPEVDESFTVNLINASLGTIDPKKAQATLIIRANDNPYGVFSIPDAFRPIRVEEAAATVSIGITRSGGTMGAVRISYRTLSQTETFPFLPLVADRATENADFAAATGFVDMAPGQKSATFSVGILDDPNPEPDESFFVVLTGIRLLNVSSTGPEVLPQLDLNYRAYGQVIINLNDNANGILDFSAVEIVVPEERTGPFLFLQRKGGQFGVVTAVFEIISITADPETDIRVTSNQVTFGSGETNKSVPVLIVDDSIPETQEDFRIRLTGEVSGGAVLGTATSCLVTIAASDDPNGVFVFSTLGITVEEPDTGLLPVQMTISRLAGQIGVVSVNWEARLNGIKIETDVTPTEGTLIFVSNERSKSLTVNVRADNASEGREDVKIVLIRASNGGRLGDSSTFTLSILPNDDPYGVVEFKQSAFLISESIGDSLQNVTIVRRMGLYNQLRITYTLHNTPLLPIIGNLSRTVYNYFMSPYFGYPSNKGIEVNISSEVDKQQACLLTCLEAKACQAIYFSISTGECSWYSSSDALSLIPDSRARYYVKNLAETQTLYQNLAEVGIDVLPYNSGVFIYPPDLNEAQLPVLVKDDDLPELEESFVITLVSVEVITTDPLTPKIMPRLGTLVSANVTIRANDNANGLFRLYSADTRAEMGGSLIRVSERASLAVELVVERFGGSIGYASVNWRVNTGKSTGTNFVDFRADGATLTFGPSETRRVFTIAILDDNIPELSESIVLELINPTGGAAIDPEKQSVSVVIEANDLVAGMIAFAKSTILVDEGDQVSIDVLRSFPGEGNVTVEWQISELSGGYNASETFMQTFGTIFFQSRVLAGKINITVLEDSKPSIDESFSIQLVSVNTSGVESSGAAQLDATKRQMVLTVRAHNRPHGLFQLAMGTLNQTTDEVNKTVTILVLRKYGSIGRVRVNFKQTNVTNLPLLTAEAKYVEDYTVEEFHIDFQDGDVQKSINISIIDDNIPEIDEVLQLTLTGVEFLGPGTTSYPPALDYSTDLSANITIRANDGTTGVAIFPPGSDRLSVNETRQKILLTVSRNMGTFGTVSVFYYSQLVTAQSTDFDIQPSTLVFNPGETTKTIEVLILDDDIPESDEAFQVVLGNPTNGLLLGTPSVSVITILSNDGAGGALNFDSAADVDISEPGDGVAFPPPKIMFNVIRGPGTFGQISFEFVVTRLDGTTDNLTDIGPLSGAITMENMQTTASFEVSANADDAPETAKTYLVRLTNPKLGATLGRVTQRRVTIVDNDSPYGRVDIVSVSGPRGLTRVNSSYYTVPEANSALTVSMVRSRGLVNRVSFDLQVLPRTASATSGAVLRLNSLQEVRATSLRRWVTFELADSLTYMLMLSSHRVAPLPASAMGSDGSDGPYDPRRITTSVLYRWQGRLEPVQTVMTDFAVDAVHFTINSQHYLAIVNQGSNDRPDSVTRIYRINPNTGALNFTQDIPTVYGSSATFYSVDGGNYLFIASYQNAKAETTVYSSVYKWDDVNQRFGASTMQLINTQGASDCLSFEHGGLRFLLVLNYFDSTSNAYTIGSVLYRYESLKASFVVHQTLPTKGAKDATIFNIGTRMFLVIANNRDGPIINNVDSVVYRWQGSNFVLHQPVSTRDAVNVFAFQGVNTASYFGITSSSGNTVVMGWSSSSSMFVDVTNFGPASQYKPVVVKQSTTSLLLLAHVNSTFDVDGATSQIYMISTIAPVSDFVPATMTMTLEEGQTHTATSVFLLDDETSEPDEHFDLVLANPQNGVEFGEQKSASIVILANDNPYGEINFDASSRFRNVEELDGRDNPVLLSMTRTGGTFARVLVQFVVVGDVTNSDIAPMSGTAEFATGSSLATITLTVKGDTVPELDERATVMLTRVTTDAATAADEYPTIGAFSNCTLLILANDNPHGVIGWEDLVVRTTEPDGMEGTVYLTMVRSQGAIGNIRISFTTFPDNSVPPNQRATAGQDYLATLSIVTMNNNQTRAQVAMIILMDNIPELTESFLVNITGVQLLDSVAAPGTQPTIRATAVTCQVLIAENDNARGIVQFNVTENLEGYVIAYEGVSQLLLQVSRTVGYFGNQTITWEAKPQTATAEDYNPSSGQVIITDQMNSAVIPINIVDDTIPETTETFLVQLVRIDGGAVIGDKHSVTVAIPPNDSPYGQFQFANSPVTVKESTSLSDPNGLAVLTVQRTQSAVGRVSMTWQLEPMARGEFVEPYQGLLVFEEGETLKNFTLRTKPDNITEGQKSFRVSLVLSGTVGDISPTRGDAVVLIQADPGSSGLIGIEPSSKRVLISEKEAPTDTGLVRVTVTRGSGTNGEVQVFWTLIPRDIENFVETQGTLVIPDSVPTGDIVLRAVDDSVPEVAKVFLLLLTGVQPSLATLSPADNQATVIMRASDFPYGLFEFTSSAPIVRPEANSQVEISVQRLGGTFGTVSVNYATRNGSATANSDYEPVLGHLTFGPGVSRATVSVQLLDDTAPEGPEDFFLVLTSVSLINPTNISSETDQPPGLGANSQQRIVIDKNDQAEGVIQFTPAGAVFEVDESVGVARVPVTRAPGSWGRVTCRYTSRNLTARPGVDYSLLDLPVVFENGQTEQTVNVTIVDDAEPEFDEQLQITLTSPDGGAILGTQLTSLVIIRKSDFPNGQFGFAPSSLSRTVENPTSDLTIDVYLSRTGGLIGQQTLYWQIFGPNSQTTVLSYTGDIAVRDNSGTEKTQGSLTWGANEGGSKSLQLSVKKRGESWEVQKTFWIVLYNPTSFPASAGNGEINPRANNVSITVQKYGFPNGILGFLDCTGKLRELIEPTPSMGLSYNVLFPVRRTQGFLGAVRVKWRILGPYDETPDFQPTEGVLNFADGVNEASVQLTILPDNKPELDEDFRVQLYEVDGGADIDAACGNASFRIGQNDNPRGVFALNQADQRVVADPITFVRRVQVNVSREMGLFNAITVSVKASYDQKLADRLYLRESSGSLQFAEGESSRQISFEMVGDNFFASGSSFTVSLDDVAFTNPADAAGGGQIPPIISGTKGSTQVLVTGDAANSNVGFLSDIAMVQEDQNKALLTLSRVGSFGQVAVTWSPGFPPGSASLPPGATSGSVATDVGRTVYLVHGQASANFTVALNPIDGASQQFGVFLDPGSALSTSAPGGARLDTARLSCEIDPRGVLEFAPTSRVVHVDETAGQVSVSIVRRFGSRGNVAVQYRTLAGSAAANQDFWPINSALSLTEGSSQATVIVQVVSDTVPETEEHFFINITSVERLPSISTGYLTPRVSRQFGLARIVIRANNDPFGLLSVTASPANASEGDSVAIVIQRDAGVSGSVTVIVRTVGGGERWISEINVQPSANNFTIGAVLANRFAASAATANADYSQLDSAVTFADGETSKTVQLNIIKDAEPELEESVLVYISLPASSPGAQMPRLADGTAKDGFKTSYAMITIVRNGVYNGVISVAPTSRETVVSEDAAVEPELRVRLQRIGSLAADVAVSWQAKVSLTSTPAEDASQLAAELATLQGEALCRGGDSCELVIPMVQDAVPERRRRYLIVLTNAQPSAELDRVYYYANVTSEPSDYPDGLVGLAEPMLTVRRLDQFAEIEIRRMQGNDRPVSVVFSTSEINSASVARGGLQVLRARTSRDFNATAGVALFQPGVTSLNIRVGLYGGSAGDSLAGEYQPRVFLFSLLSVDGGATLSPGKTQTNVTIVDNADAAAWHLLNMPLSTSAQLTAALSEAQKFSSPSVSLSQSQLTLLSSFLGKVNLFASTATETLGGALSNEQKTAVYSVYCALIQSARTDVTTSRSELALLLADFSFAITPAGACELTDQLFNACPEIVTRAANLHPRNINSKVYLNTATDLNSNREPYFKLPAKLLPDNVNSSLCQKVQFTVFKSSQWFKVSTLDILTDTIYSFSLDNKNLDEVISTPVQFRVINYNRLLVDRRARCAYWSGTDWQSGLCTVDNQAGLDAGQDDFVACSCNHLSSYAVVIDKHPATLVGYNLWFYIPLGIAAFVYLFVVIANCFFASNISQFSAHLQLHMLIAVFVFHIIYIVNAALSPSSILVNSMAQRNDRCIAVSVLQTYFFLCQFFWMLAQSVNYWKVLVMNDEHTNRSYHIFIIIGWVVPAVWVLLCTVVSYAVFLNVFPEIAPDQLVGSVNNNGFICYIKQLYVMLIVILLPILVVLVGLLFVFVNAYQVLPQWAMYDDICKGRPNHKEVRNLLIFWALLFGCTLFGGLHMAYSDLWWLIIYAVLEIITAAFALASFFALRGPAALLRAAAGGNAGQSYEIQEEWRGIGEGAGGGGGSGSSVVQRGTFKEKSAIDKEAGINDGDAVDDGRRRQSTLDHLQLVKEINEDQWSDQQPHFNGQTLTFDNGVGADWRSSPGYGRIDLPDDLEGEADVDGFDIDDEGDEGDNVEVDDDEEDDNDAEADYGDAGDFDDLIYALKSETAEDSSDNGDVDGNDDDDSGTVVSGPASDRQSQRNWRMSIADTHL